MGNKMVTKVIQHSGDKRRWGENQEQSSWVQWRTQVQPEMNGEEDLSPFDFIFLIFIRTLEGKSVSLQIQNFHTILEVKALFKAKGNGSMIELKLIFEGNFLKDQDHISYYNIGRNSTLHISFRLRGGSIGRGASSSSKPSFRDVIDKRTSPTQPEGTKTS